MTDRSSNPGVSRGSGKPPAILDLIGHTPLVELTRFDTGPCRLFLKLENQNPGGSIKDRIGLKMVEAAEREGKLEPGGLLVEATAGNTGLGLALAAAAKGYRLILVIPDKMALEKINHLKSLGVDIRITRSDVGKGHPEYYQDMAQRIAAEQGGFYVQDEDGPCRPEGLGAGRPGRDGKVRGSRILGDRRDRRGFRAAQLRPRLRRRRLSDR
jgi:cystathionine beta-synthase